MDNLESNEQLLMRIDALEQQVESHQGELDTLRERNAHVERDKAWETSKIRVSFLLAFTYVGTSLVFFLISIPNPLLNALVPTFAYFLSVQSLPLLRAWWFKRN
jgi:hypothetical protein